MSFSWSRATGVAAAAILIAVAAGPKVLHAAAGPTVIKMATLAPEGSAWYKLLERIGEDWKKVTGGAVVLRLYGGGIVGDEETMIRKMRVGQLQAAAVTGLGLASLEKSFYALHIPMMFASDEEFSSVRDRLAPRLEEQLAEKGFIVLTWGDAGWITFFTKNPVVRPDEAKAAKLFIGTDDSTIMQLYKETGFQPVTLSSVDILPGLQTGLINAFVATPLAALAFQWFALAPNMADLRFAPLTGATIIDRRAWEKIPAELRPKLMEAARAGGTLIRDEIRRLNDEAVSVMTKNGLKIGRLPPGAQADWEGMIEEIYPKIRGPIIPAEAFDAARAARDEYRVSRSKGSGIR